MSSWCKTWAGLLALACASISGWCQRGSTQPLTSGAAIQAIQQAPDPSAVVAAYASALAFNMNDPNLHAAYVARMVDMGLPELAFHQAETLTTLQPNNGLAWGVVAYVDARRGQMPEAVAAINLAGQFAPNNKFIDQTAGEILAWYDLKADKSQLPDSAKAGLTRLRGLVEKQPAFTTAYDTARKAYATPPAASTSSTNAGAYAPQAEVSGDQGSALTYVAPASEPLYTPVYYPSYYDYAPDYYYDWGPGWVAPSAWYWWYPCGYWSGCNFFPFGVTLAFGDFYDFHHSHHGEGFAHYGGFRHDYDFGRRHDPVWWHRGSHGRTTFFGTPVRPSSSLARWDHRGTEHRSVTPTGGSTHWWSSAGHVGSSFAAGSGIGSSRPNMHFESRAPFTSGGASFAHAFPPSRQGIWSAAPSTSERSRTFSRAPTLMSPATHSWSSGFRSYHVAPTPRSTLSSPAYRAPAYSVPRYGTPTSRSFGAFHSAPSFGGFAHRSAPTFAAPAAPRSFGGDFHGGGFRGGSSFHSFGGGFRGGGFSGGHSVGGGFHGGGHR